MPSIHGIEYDYVKRSVEDKVRQKPYWICQYNTFMSGVDKWDQYLNTYCINRRSVKWWKNIF